MDRNKLIFTLSEDASLGQEIASILHTKLGASDVQLFADGEIMSRALDPVENKDVFIVESTNYPAHEKIMKILIFVDSLKRAKAKSINLIIPYYGYSRQDRVADYQEPISAQLVAKMFEVSGVDTIHLIDIHSPVILDFFSIPAFNYSMGDLLALEVKKHLTQEELNDNIAVASPDEGGQERAINFIKNFENADILCLKKIRQDDFNVKIIEVEGNVEGKNVIVFDDMIGTGGTVLAATKELLERKANKVIVVCTHPVLSAHGRDLIEYSNADQFIFSNTIPCKQSEKVKVISCAPLIAKIIEEFK